MRSRAVTMGARFAAVLVLALSVAFLAALPARALADDGLTSADVDMSQFADAELKAQAQDSTPVDMYRLYNPNSGEHFYTASSYERSHLISVGWHNEGIGWRAPKSSSVPVYRLYNPNAGDHHYTTSAYERDELKKKGWRDEGTGWYSDENEKIALLRQYNPNAKAGAHNFTASQFENDSLVKAGWRAEKIGWYAIDYGAGAEALSFIYLDAGHGTGSSYPGQFDPGAIGCGYREADLTAELVNLVAKYAREEYGLLVYSNVGSGVQYYNRQADAKKRGCTSLVSIHFNAGGGSGSESYRHSRYAGTGSQQLQSIIHKHLINGTGLRNRGAMTKELAVCNAKDTGLPATLLEVAFIDKQSDMSQYQSRKDKIARELAAGLYEAAKAGF